MKRMVRTLFKHLLTLIGTRLSARTLHNAEVVVCYMKLGRWAADHGFRFRRVAQRAEVFDAVAKRIRDKRVLYLEFGVFQGASMRYWSDALKHPEAKLHGFDSFEGLPEYWEFGCPKGTFSVQGEIPDITDPRVRFFKGWFEDVLPTYSIAEHDVLVLNMDADLYSSTIYVLRHLRAEIRAGTFIYFDDMSRPDHEPRAFDEFMKESGLSFRPLCANRSLQNMFFECTG